MFDLISDNTLLQTMDRTMTLAARRTALVASNIANIDTPGYKTQDFSFEETLRQELGQGSGQEMPIACTHPMHLSGSASFSTVFSGGSRPAYERNDGNDVNLDQENMKLMRAQATYQLASNFAQTAVRKILQTIRDGVAH